MIANDEIPIYLPKIGNQMEEGTITKWLVTPGSVISKGQIIFEMETDKASIDVESDYAGRVTKIIIGDGQSAKIGEPIAYLQS